VGNGTLKGVVYIGTDTQNRVAGASVSVSPGGRSATAGDTGYFEFSLSPGQYTITANATGYNSNSVTRTITAGADTWGSVSVTPAAQENGTYRGVVYDARAADYSVRLEGARVRLSNGNAVTTGADGAFVFSVAPGMYTATAELNGWDTNFTQRTVVAGQTTWGSIGLVPAGTQTNRPPKLPELESPIDGATVVSVRPIFTVENLDDPDGDARGGDLRSSGSRIVLARFVGKARCAFGIDPRLVAPPWERSSASRDAVLASARLGRRGVDALDGRAVVCDHVHLAAHFAPLRTKPVARPIAGALVDACSG
jgi:hypothetical protein